MIAKIENMNDIADTLEQLWLSYNQVEKLSGVERLEKLRQLYLSNNKVRRATHPVGAGDPSERPGDIGGCSGFRRGGGAPPARSPR